MCKVIRLSVIGNGGHHLTLAIVQPILKWIKMAKVIIVGSSFSPFS